MRTLYLKATTDLEIASEWGINPNFKSPHRLIQCSKQGVVRWHTARVYSDAEVINLLIKGRRVVIIPS